MTCRAGSEGADADDVACAELDESSPGPLIGAPARAGVVAAAAAAVVVAVASPAITTSISLVAGYTAITTSSDSRSYDALRCER